MHFTSASLMWIEDQTLGSCAHVKLVSGMTNLLSDSSATRVSMSNLNVTGFAKRGLIRAIINI